MSKNQMLLKQLIPGSHVAIIGISSIIAFMQPDYQWNGFSAPKKRKSNDIHEERVKNLE